MAAGAQCIPSCAQYSIECFEKHGLIMGWLMTCDRIFHEADEMKQAPMILINNSYRFYDPVENNDFWWYND
ncbi:MAG: membrane protein insertion efficiency factor YidD [Proteobacteria bacterium]|nr:membrane protein insertion efficiency factor YidD [Pseudomonadota bacterium]